MIDVLYALQSMLRKESARARKKLAYEYTYVYTVCDEVVYVIGVLHYVYSSLLYTYIYRGLVSLLLALVHSSLVHTKHSIHSSICYIHTCRLSRLPLLGEREKN